MLSFLSTLVVVLLLFGLTIFIHELGHFLVARKCGLVVETFSIGFGPALWKRTIGGVTYKIGCLPLGGYVALPQLDPSTGIEAADQKTSEPAGEPRPPLPPVAPGRKILVSLAGAGGNVVLAVALALILAVTGKPSSPEERTTVIGYVATNSVAAAAGLQPGDEIAAVGGQPVKNWIEIKTAVTLQGRDDVAVEVRRADGGILALTLPAERHASLGVRLLKDLDGPNIARVFNVEPDSAAADAGLQRGDRILAFNGETIRSRQQLSDLVNLRRDQPTPLRVQRARDTLDLSVRPAWDEKLQRARMGIQFDTIGAVDFDQEIKPAPGALLREQFGMIFRFLRALVTPGESKAAMEGTGGPIAILMMFWMALGASFKLALYFTCFMNVNLAVFNLLPIPVLDGGHIIFAGLEKLNRKPLNARIVNRIHQVFAYFFIGLMILLLARDVQRFVVPMFGSSREPAAATTTNAPPAAAAPEAKAPTAP